MGTNATLHTVVTPTGRVLLAPLDQYNPYVDGLNCKLCGEPTSAAHPYGDAPHAIGCIYGDGFEDVNVIEARAIAAERIDQAGGRIAEDFLNEFYIARTHRDIVVDDVLHATEGTCVLLRAIEAPGSLELFMVSMATGDVLRLPRRQFNAITTDVDGQMIEAGAMVEDITSGARGTVTTVDFGTKVVMVKGRRQFGRTGDYLRVIDVITLRWETTVAESHSEIFPLADVAKALGVPTDKLTTDEVRQAVERVLDEHADTDTGDGSMCDVESLLIDEEGTTYAENCDPSTESRVLLGHGEG